MIKWRVIIINRTTFELFETSRLTRLECVKWVSKTIKDIDDGDLSITIEGVKE